MTERQIDIMANLSAWQRTIGAAQGVLDSVETPAAKRAASDLDVLSSQMHSFMLDLMMTEGDKQK